MKASKRVWSLVALCSALLVVFGQQESFGQSIQALPAMSPSGVSADGLTVVGTGFADGNNQPVLWRAGVTQYLGKINNDHTFGHNISDDGQVVVGSDYNVVGFRWTEGGGFQGIGATDIPLDLTPDGAIIVGQSTSGATRWTQATGVTLLGNLAGGGDTISSQAITPDGQVIVGFGYRPGTGVPEAFRWTQAGGAVGLSDLAGGDTISEARAVSADGAVAVGYGAAADGTQAVRWTASGIEGLGHLPGYVPTTPFVTSTAVAIAADGSFILGTDVIGGNQGVAFWWDETGGMQTLADVLSNRYGVDTTGWQLQTIIGLSADGNTIIGMGRFGSSVDSTGFRVTLVPEPSSWLLAVIGAATLATVVRRRRRS